MIKQFVILGLGKFGQSMAEELSLLRVELIVVDKDEILIDRWKERVAACYIADVADVQNLLELVPEKANGIIVDLGDNTEASILVIHHLAKAGHRNIMVRAQSPGHAEIVSLLGARQVVFPDREAARRLVPSLVSSGLISYTPMGRNLAFAEVPVPEIIVGMKVGEAGFRGRYNLNIIAVRLASQGGAAKDNLDNSENIDYQSASVDSVFEEGMVLLVSGTGEAIQDFAKQQSATVGVDLVKKAKGLLRR